MYVSLARLMAVVVLTASCGYARSGDFESECRKIAKIEVIDDAGWQSYLRALSLYYKNTGQFDEHMKLWPVGGFPVRTDQSLASPNSDQSRAAYRNDYNVFAGGRPVARVRSLTLSIESLEGRMDSHCVYNYPEMYDLPRSDVE